MVHARLSSFVNVYLYDVIIEETGLYTDVNVLYFRIAARVLPTFPSTLLACSKPTRNLQACSTISLFMFYLITSCLDDVRSVVWYSHTCLIKGEAFLKCELFPNCVQKMLFSFHARQWWTTMGDVLFSLALAVLIHLNNTLIQNRL